MNDDEPNYRADRGSNKTGAAGAKDPLDIAACNQAEPASQESEMPCRSISGGSTASTPPVSQDAVAGPGAATQIKKKIRVMLVDDHVVMRQGLARLISGEEDLEIDGEASDGASAVRLAQDLRPDVIIMDVSMPRMNGIEATRLIHAELPGVRIIGLSMFAETDRAAAMLNAGASAYLTKSGETETLLATLRACAAPAEVTKAAASVAGSGCASQCVTAKQKDGGTTGRQEGSGE